MSLCNPNTVNLSVRCEGQILGFVEPPKSGPGSLQVCCQLAKPTLEVTSSTFEGLILVLIVGLVDQK